MFFKLLFVEITFIFPCIELYYGDIIPRVWSITKGPKHPSEISCHEKGSCYSSINTSYSNEINPLRLEVDVLGAFEIFKNI
jgi:hypothetical protein